MIQQAQKDGQWGYRWGDAGRVFLGEDARARAEAVGRALSARPEDSEWTLAEIEEFVAKADADKVLQIIQLQNRYGGAKSPKGKKKDDADAVDLGPVVESPKGVRELHPTVQRSSDPLTSKVQVDIKKFAEEGEQQLVWAEVYVPGMPDSHGNVMTATEIRKMAHKFMKDALTQAVDVQHDGDESRDLYIVESFVVDHDGHPDGYFPGSWVVCCHVEDPRIWQAVKNGELNGFSMEARVFMQDRLLEIEIPDEGLSGETELAAEPGEDLHRHGFTVTFSLDGTFIGGQTTTNAGHFHPITRGSLTDGLVPAGTTGKPLAGTHTHRYSMFDSIMLDGAALDALG